MKKSVILLVASGIFGSALVLGQSCEEIANSVTTAVSVEGANVPEIVDGQVALTPNCVCEIVKAAIQGSEAEGQEVADIVTAAGNAAPGKLQEIVNCASAVASESSLPFIESAATAVQESNPGGGNPLNFPGGRLETSGGLSEGTNGWLKTQVQSVAGQPPVTNPNPASN